MKPSSYFERKGKNKKTNIQIISILFKQRLVPVSFLYRLYIY